MVRRMGVRKVDFLCCRPENTHAPAKRTMMDYIQFPPIKPELYAFEAFGMTFALRWYALAYIAGLLIGWWLIRRATQM
jgi:hypothetical protein